VCDCSPNNWASNTQAPYYEYIVSGLPICAIYLQLFHEYHNFKKDVNKHKIFVSMFSETCHKEFKFKVKWGRCYRKGIQAFKLRTRYYCQVLLYIKFFSTDFCNISRFLTKLQYIVLAIVSTNCGNVKMCVIFKSVHLMFSCGKTDSIKNTFICPECFKSQNVAFHFQSQCL
jgi:hypothetical protein